MTSVVNDYLILTKVRITALVLVTTAAGFLLASSARLDPALLAWTLLGTGLAAGGGIAEVGSSVAPSDAADGAAPADV